MRNRDRDGSVAADLSLRRGLLHRRRLHVEDRLVLDFLDIDEHRQPHRPAAVVVGAQLRIRIALLFEKILRKPSVRLIALDDVRTGGKRAIADLDFRGRLTNFDALQTQNVNEGRNPGHVTLQRNDEPERRILLARLDRVLRFLIEVLDDQVWKRRRQLQRAEDARLHVVRVVPA